ncbi:MAG: hypothetical protein ACOX5R_08305 [bacterium]|jgi:hypothetical protein
MLESDMAAMSNEELMQQLEYARHRIEDYERRVSSGEVVDYGEIRKAMGDVNHLKIHAARRGLSVK